VDVNQNPTTTEAALKRLCDAIFDRKVTREQLIAMAAPIDWHLLQLPQGEHAR